jgi:2-C-methyl-D-erythritol 4-phosphate cytidylyltransferase
MDESDRFPYICFMMVNSMYAVIVSGGSGKRMGAEIPKQFLLLNGLPVLAHTLKAFFDFNAEIELIVVLPPESIETWKSLCKEYKITIPHTMVMGGAERFDSVQNGLNVIKSNSGLVAIHDGVRPLVSRETITRCLDAAELTGAAIPVLELTDSLRFRSEHDSKAVNRKDYVTVQTPQCFSLEKIREAYKSPFNASFTDDASVFEESGFPVELVKGNPENIKITVPGDIELAEFFIRRRENK